MNVNPAARKRTVALVSGNGTNLQAVIDAVRAGKLPLDLVAVVSNNAGAYALVRARNVGIQTTMIVWNRAAESREQYDRRLTDAVAALRPQLVLLLGWMHILPAEFIARFPDIINIHPAYLPLDQAQERVTMPDGCEIPALRGARAIDDLFGAKLRWGGATAHRVSLDADRGPVLARAALQVEENEPSAAFTSRLHELEHRVLLHAIERWLAGKTDELGGVELER